MWHAMKVYMDCQGILIMNDKASSSIELSKRRVPKEYGVIHLYE